MIFLLRLSIIWRIHYENTISQILDYTWVPDLCLGSGGCNNGPGETAISLTGDDVSGIGSFFLLKPRKNERDLFLAISLVV